MAEEDNKKRIEKEIRDIYNENPKFFKALSTMSNNKKKNGKKKQTR